MSAPATPWHFSGEYFENCNCDVVCPCVFSAGAPLTARPTKGDCEVALAFHINQGTYGDVALDGLNTVVAAYTPGPMGAGNWKLALYLDDHADDRQREALQAIFSGQVGGVMGMFAPLVGQVLDVKSVPIGFTMDGNHRSMEIPNVMRMGVEPIAAAAEGLVIWAENAPAVTSRVALAKGVENSTYQDYGMRWDNSGKNGHFAPIEWSNA